MSKLTKTEWVMGHAAFVLGGVVAWENDLAAGIAACLVCIVLGLIFTIWLQDQLKDNS